LKLPLSHVLPLKCKILLGSAQKNKPVLSPLAVFLASCASLRDYNLAAQSVSISFTSLASPQTSLQHCCVFFKFCSHVAIKLLLPQLFCYIMRFETFTVRVKIADT
jgi:hypothetical protein